MTEFAHANGANECAGKYAVEDLLMQLKMFREDYGDIVKLEGIPGRRPCVFVFDAELNELMHRIEGVWPTRIAMESLHYYRTNRPEIYDIGVGLATG